MNLLTSSSTLFSSNGELSKAQKAHRENERSNLATITRLVLRSVLDHSMKAFNRIIEGDSSQLSDFLILLEKVLFHGLKTTEQRSLLSFRSPDQDLWLAIGKAMKRSSDQEDPQSRAYLCVEHLEYLKTSISKVRALLRVSLMQKRLHDMFQVIVASPALSECWEEWAILRSVEADPIIGSLIGLSVLNCNLHIDFGHLQDQPLSVDLAQYIKIPNLPTLVEGSEEVFENKLDDATRQGMKTLLDQNNYLEERNRVLEDKLMGLRSKLDNGSTSSFDCDSISFRRLSAESAEREVNVWKEKEKQWDLEKTRLLGIITERDDGLKLAAQQLKDLTELNRDLYEKLKHSEAAEKKLENDFVVLRQKHQQDKEALRKRMSSLLAESEQGKDLQGELNELSDKFSASLTTLDEKQQELRELRKDFEALRIEKERAEREAKSVPQLKEEVTDLREKLQKEVDQVAELQAALEEIGPQLSLSKLKILELREESLPMCGEWQKDGEVVECNGCEINFSISKRKHHCRACGRIFCASCSSCRVRLPSSSNPVRVCTACYRHLQLLYDPSEITQNS